MTSTGLWPLVHQERLRFADLLAVLLAMSGRRAGLDDLTGDGVSTMTARMP
jgi:hypothetical protein